VKTIMDTWEVIINSDTKQAYIDSCNRFKIVFDKFPKFLKNVETTILGKVKEKVVWFWVNQFIHMGNVTTNKVESAHNQLKKYLNNSMSDLSTNWKFIHNM
jgi:hypothetical protein